MAIRTRSGAYAAMILVAALWASSTVAARGLLNALPPMTLGFLRWTAVILVMLPFVWRERAAMVAAVRADFRTYATLALLGCGPQTCLVYFALQGSTAVVLGLLNSTIPVLIVAIMALTRHRKPQPLEVAGLAISLAGIIAIIARGSPSSLLALDVNGSDLLLLSTMVIWSLYTVKLAERPKALSLQALVFVAAVLGLAFITPLFVAELLVVGVSHVGAAQALGIVYVATLPTVVAGMLFGHALARVGAAQGGFFTHLVPVFAAVFAALFLGERLYPYHAAGFVLVAGGAVLCCLRPDPVLSSPATVRPRTESH